MGSGLSKDRRFLLGEEIDRYFASTDIEKTFDLLEQYFHVSKEWRRKFRERTYRFRKRDERELFFEFMQESLEPALKQITLRNDSITLSLMKYVIRMKINRQ